MTVPQPLSIEQIAALPADKQQAYIAALPPAQQQQVQAQLAAQGKRAILQAGADYLARTLEKTQLCVMTSGGALSQAFPAAGGTLSFTVPQTLNGWMTDYIIRVTGTITLAAGTSAVYALTAAGVLGLFPEVVLQYGNNQHRFPLRVLQDYKQLRGKIEPVTWEPVLGSGRAIASEDTYINGGGTFGVAVGANTWTFETVVPCNLIHGLDPRGALPIMGGSTTPTIQLTCNSAIIGADSMKNVLYAVSGTGHAVSAIALTISVFARYRDGDTLTSRQKMNLNLGSLGTMQMAYDGTLANLAANQLQPYQIKHVGKHYYVLAYVIDAQLSQTFCVDTNIAQVDITKDASGQNAFWRYGGDTNIGVQEWLANIRRDIKQDLAEGCLPFVYGPGQNTVNVDNSDGIAVFDNTPENGWPAAQFRVKASAVGALGSGPRVEYYVIYENPNGLQAIG
jgi:hypothetical protein